MTLRQRVLRIIKDNPKLANSDRALIIAVWQAEGMGFSNSQIERLLNNTSSPESIRRTRQKLAQDNEIEVNKAIRKIRKANAKNMKSYYGYDGRALFNGRRKPSQDPLELL